MNRRAVARFAAVASLAFLLPPLADAAVFGALPFTLIDRFGIKSHAPIEMTVTVWTFVEHVIRQHIVLGVIAALSLVVFPLCSRACCIFYGSEQLTPAFQILRRLIDSWSLLPVFLLSLIVVQATGASLHLPDIHLRSGFWLLVVSESLIAISMTLSWLDSRKSGNEPSNEVAVTTDNEYGTDGPAIELAGLVTLVSAVLLLIGIGTNFFAVDAALIAVRKGPYSVWQGVVALLREGEHGFAILVFSVSVLFPATKVLVVVGILFQEKPKVPGPVDVLLVRGGPVSMLDALVVACVGACVVAYPLINAELVLYAGFWSFTASVMLMSIATKLISLGH